VTKDEIHDVEVGLAMAKEKLKQAVVAHERAAVALREAESEHAKYAEKLGRIAYRAAAAPTPGNTPKEGG